MLEFYNTVTRKKETFKEIEKGKVKIYSCGPTVYSYQHIGNMRAALFVDILKRTFRYFDYEVIDVVNITDVGHLVSDEDQGEDKMLKAAKLEKKDPYQIARFYEDAYIKDLVKLHVIMPKYMPRATEHIAEQLKVIEELEKKGYTYQTSDGIYFDTSKYKDYGKLSGQKLEDKKAGARVEVKSEKRNPTDFALWKFLTGDNKNHIMKWDSKWGVGFPGWHIECSAMSAKYLGEKFDIHTGGIDHITVHHENEIAQNVCSSCVKKINFWMHNAHLLVNSEKMSKSLGNVYLISDLEKKKYSPLAFRELVLRTHYRKSANFTFESLEAGMQNVRRINEFRNKLKAFKPSAVKTSLQTPYENSISRFEDAISDDLNTPEALAVLYDFMTAVNKKEFLSAEDVEFALDFIQRTDAVFGLLEDNEVPKEVLALAKEREKARAAKDFKKSDELRAEIEKNGYIVRDSKEAKEGFILDKVK